MNGNPTRESSIVLKSARDKSTKLDPNKKLFAIITEMREENKVYEDVEFPRDIISLGGE